MVCALLRARYFRACVPNVSAHVLLSLSASAGLYSWPSPWLWPWFLPWPWALSWLSLPRQASRPLLRAPCFGQGPQGLRPQRGLLGKVPPPRATRPATLQVPPERDGSAHACQPSLGLPWSRQRGCRCLLPVKENPAVRKENADGVQGQANRTSGRKRMT